MLLKDSYTTIRKMLIQHLVHLPVKTLFDPSNHSIVDVSDTPVAEHIIEATVFTGTSSLLIAKSNEMKNVYNFSLLGN